MNSEKKAEENYWTQRYENGNTGWDIGDISRPLKTYFDQLTSQNLRILIPGAGNGYEAAYLHQQEYTDITVLDISEVPLQNFINRVPTFPKDSLIQENFFDHHGQYDLIIEQTFFCSLEPTIENRKKYAQKMAKLLRPKGKLVGLWFKHPLTEESNRPFGGSKEEYLSYLAPYFDSVTFENCFNSIPERAGNELFGIFKKINL
ncbi:MAG: methyltransferase domain-containing protein [Bacteroidetes bacterium]|nr:methyltransferase domain-containing protein [Bacteroidota bacterium]